MINNLRQCLMMLVVVGVCAGPFLAGTEAAKPNILVILTDDMGFSDLGCYGGEIRTPNLDQLAAQGLRFTQFYNAARCCPTRASLLTGIYPHQAAIGFMDSPLGKLESYRGDLSHRAVTLAELLKTAGYGTYAVGKWHVTQFNWGLNWSRQPKRSQGNWPLQRGFDRFYGIIGGGGSYFEPFSLARDNTPITAQSDPEYQPESYYFTDAVTDQAICFLAEHHQKQPVQPFFMYVAHLAPHNPLHARDEDNVISHSMCSGITLGRYELPAGSKPPTTNPGFVRSIELAVRDGWTREKIGGHVVRNNHISHCEKNAIHGSLGGIFSTIIGNRIHDIAVRKWVYGEDTAAIKLLGSQGVLIQGNRIYRNALGLWLDWMAQGTRVSGNLFYQNGQELFLEVNHGPCLLDNNLFLSATKVENRSEGIAFVHNLFTGTFIAWLDHRRATPWFKPHSTEIAGMNKVEIGDDRFLNNLFVGQNQPAFPVEVMRETMAANKRMVGWGIGMYDFWPTPPMTGGNVYCLGAQPCSNETDAVLSPDDPGIRVEDCGSEVYLHIQLGDTLAGQRAQPATAARLGVAQVSRAPFENPDGTPMDLTRDYFGKSRQAKSPTVGPFETPAPGRTILKVWPPTFTRNRKG